jgi:hypothetical protein
VKEMTEPNPLLTRCFARHGKDYARLSATPDQFKAFVGAVGLVMKTQPNYSAHDRAEIRVPVTIVQSEHDEFIKHEHAEYLARNIPGAELVVLPGVTHFAPLQRPDQFNAAIFAFLRRVLECLRVPRAVIPGPLSGILPCRPSLATGRGQGSNMRGGHSLESRGRGGDVFDLMTDSPSAPYGIVLCLASCARTHPQPGREEVSRSSGGCSPRR